MTFDEVRHYVAQRKLMYQRSLAQADKMLMALVSQNPKNLKEAQAIQADYTAGCAVLELKASEQPVAEAPVEKSKPTATFVGTSTPGQPASGATGFGKAGDGGAPVK